MWLVEQIPNEDRLFYRIHKSYVVDGEVVPGAFQERGEGAERGMSTDWEKYSTAEETRQHSKIPADNGIAAFLAGAVRAIDLEVSHAPLPDNRAHSHVKGIPHEGQLKTQARLKLKRIFQWQVRV
jgi:hypothetical protein